MVQTPSHRTPKFLVSEPQGWATLQERVDRYLPERREKLFRNSLNRAEDPSMERSLGDGGLAVANANATIKARGPEHGSDTGDLVHALPSEWWLQGVIALFVLAYAVSTFVVHRPPSGYNTIWDGWVENVASTLPIIPILLCARRLPVLRAAWLAMAGGIVLNTAGNLVWTYHDQNLHPIPNPAPSDALYLSSYVAFIAGVAFMTQSSFGRVHSSVRLDGAITGLAIAAVAGMLWFEPVLHVSGRPFQVIVGMAYPVSDLVLLVLLIAGLAPHRYRPNWSTALLMLGVFWYVVGDVINLNQSAAGTYVGGTPLDATWVIGLFLIGLAASVRDRRRSRAPRTTVSSPSGITLVPIVFGLVSLGVIVTSLYLHHSSVVIILAVGALVLVIARMWMTLREVGQSAVNYQDARTDSLTGLPNRRSFLEGVESTLCQEDAAQAGVLLVDLDGFKEVNDALGHAVGDELLCVVSKRFEARLGDRGVLARLGGDEYACACPVATEEELVSIAHEFAQTLSEPCVLDGISVRVGASIGVAVSQHADSSAGELLRSADVAMYEAKRLQSEVAVYRAESDPNSRERLALLDALRDAIDTRAFTLHYQPTLDMHSAEVRGVEALVRWQHPTLGLLQPDSFIPMAERAGLMPQLTRAILDQAIAQAAYLDRNGQHLQMSVNISRYDLVDEKLADYIEDLLARYSFPHDRLTLEITESALGGDPERAERSVQELRARGLRISVDDFGVGYSSMSQLLGLAIDELKIDKSFVLGLNSDPRAEAIVRSAIELARALDLTVVAEGIECLEVLQTLQTIGSDVGQGYVIAYPLTPKQLDEFLAQPHTAHGLLPDLTSFPASI
jgi:diguanylate cyclase